MKSVVERLIKYYKLFLIQWASNTSFSFKLYTWNLYFVLLFKYTVVRKHWTYPI